MTALENFKKYKSFPSTLIVNGLSPLGVQVALTLLEQKGLVIIIDKYTKENKTQIDKLSQFESFTFVNLAENPDFLEKIEKVDYLIYLDHENLDVNPELSPNDFLKRINVLDTFLGFATDRKSKVLLTTSLKTHQYSLSEYSKEEYTPTRPAYSNVEQQRYSEKLLFDFNKKYNLDVRILRLGDIYGPTCEIKKDTTINQLIRQALKSKALKVYGDGLEENFIIHINDATYGLVKALFSQDTNGEIFNLANFEDNSTLSIAYALIETSGKAREVKFLDEKEKAEPAPFDSTPNLSKIGWKPRISLARGLAETTNWLQERPNDRSYLQAGRQDLETLIGVPIDKAFQKTNETALPVLNNIRKKILNFFFETDSQLLLQPKDRKKGILEKISKTTVTKKRVSIEKDLHKKITKPERKKSKSETSWKKLTRDLKANKSKLVIGIIVTAIFYFAFFEPVVSFFGNTALAGINGYKAVESLKANDFENFNEQLGKLEFSMSKAQKSLERTRWIFRLVGASESNDNMVKFASATRHLIRGGQYSTELVSAFSEYLQNFTIDSETTQDYSPYLESIYLNTNSFELAYFELLKADELLEQIDYKSLPMISALEETVTLLREELISRISSYKNFVPILPATLGYPTEKTYLLIFQNDTELRSTGGFIGSYGILKLDNGRIAEITIDDIYNPDGQLKTFVEPPESLKILLGDASWAMRDANWEPDFPTAARQVEWFYKLETERDVDGVIAVNTSIIEELLKLTGPIYLPEDEVTVSTENFFDEAEKHHQTFTPGSMDKRDFLSSLTQELLTEISKKDYQFLAEAGKLIEKLLNSREIFIYLNDPKAQRVVTSKGWDGSIEEFDGEYLFPVENNLGGNKVNRYVERTIDHEITLEEDKAIHHLDIQYENASQTTEWPGGEYLNYITIFIPKESTEIQLEGLSDPIISDRYNYKAISGTIKVGIQSTAHLTVNYTTNTVKDIPVNKKVFDYLMQKQSGVEDTYVNLTINYPEEWHWIESESDLSEQISNGSLKFFGLQETDVKLELKFSTEGR